MGLTERIELRLDSELLARVDDWMERTENSGTRSEAIRRLIELGLGTITGKAIHLTDGDKLNFLLLADIAKALKVKTEVDTEFMSEVMFGGHYWGPTWKMTGLFHNHADKPADVTFVVNVMSMWTWIERALPHLSPDDMELVKAAHYGYEPKFSGFDGNNEAELLGIARFLIEQLQRFEDFKGRDLGMGMPSSGQYQRMLRAFEPMKKRLDYRNHLSAKQIVELIEASKSR